MKNEASLKDAICEALLEGICTMDYRPGEILTEKSLIEKFNCSKSPVREALIALCADNVLRSIPRYGYEVVRLTMDDIREMLQFRLILEGGMLRERYARISASQLARLAEIDAKCKLATSDVWKHWEYNTEFHLKLMGFCGSNYALVELTRCMSRLKRAYAQFYWDKWDREVPALDTRNHGRILACIENRDPEGIVECLRDDLNDFGGLEGFHA